MTLLAAALLAASLAASCSAPTESAAPTEPGGTSSRDASHISFSDDFDTDPSRRWEPITPAAWRWDKAAGNYELARNVPLTESVRAPFNRNLAKGVVVGDFQLDVDLQSTTRDYPNQSLCLFFGYQDPEHMYYVHFGRKASDTSNQIFIVDGKDRTPISTGTTPGTPWDDTWHHARVTRDVATGEVKVYFDDLKTPAMTAKDTTFRSGRVGIGSFDDTGRFDNVKLEGTRADR